MAKIGDYIKFRVLVREGFQTATRKVVGTWGADYEVRFRGYSRFIVHPQEVISIVKNA